MQDKQPVTINIGSGADAHFDARMLVRDAEELRRRASLAEVRQEFEQSFANHGRFADRLSALSRTGACPADDVVAKLSELAQQWFAPNVTSAIYGHIDRLSEPLVSEATALAGLIAADPAAATDKSGPQAAVLREQMNGLDKRIDDAMGEARGLFKDLATTQGLVEQRVRGLERTARALAASGLEQAALGSGCAAFCRKVWVVGKGSGYLTISGPTLVFQPVQTTGMLFWKTDHVGGPETLDVSSGVSLTELHQPMLGDHRATLQIEPPNSMSIQLSLSREALDDLISAAT